MSELARAGVSTDEVAVQQLDGRILELASGIDALYLSGRGEPCGRWMSRVDELREAAQDFGGPVPVELGGLLFAVAPHGWGKYRYCLDHPIGRLGFSPSRHLPAIRVQPRSEFLHAVGPHRAVETFKAMLDPICQDLTFAVSRIDLYADFVGFDVDFEGRNSFVCKAHELRTYHDRERLTGIEFGSRRSGSICARIYDKSLDVLNKGSDWWYEIWGDELPEGVPVQRVELEFHRQALAEFDLNTPTEVITGAGALWRYGTEEWLTRRCPTKDANRCRWPIAPEWEMVQHAQLSLHTVELARLKNARRAGSLRRLTPGLVGYLVGFAALVGTTDVEDTLDALDRHVRNDEIVRRTSFSERIQRRRLERKSA